VISVVLAVIGVMVVPGYYLEERIRGWMAWQSYEAEAKARGVKMDLADYIPPKVADAENFAAIPIFDAVFRADDHGQKVPNPFELPKRDDREIPKTSDPTKQVPIDLKAWQSYFVEIKWLAAPSNNAAADVLKALDHYDAPLAQLHEAELRPRCRFPVHYEKGYSASLPHFALLQAAARLESLRLSAHLALGDNAAALEDFHHGMILIAATADEPTLIAGLVRISIAAVMDNALWGGLAAHQWSDSDLRKIEADLAAMDWLKDYVYAMGSERAGFNSECEIIIKNPHQLDNLLKEHDDKMRVFLAFYPTGWFYQSKVRMNRYFDELLARIEPAQRRFHGERPIPSSPKYLVDMSEQIRFALFRITAPVFESVESNFVQIAAVTDEARVACALERFRLAHGNAPSTLGELVPEFLPAAPVEIVNGDSYHYRRTDDGSFILYSVGMNLRDDGGVIDPKLTTSKQLDWVWRYPAK
jgi:hypothetical protein